MKICARSAQALEMQKPLALTPKKKMNKVYGKKYRINLDHQILTDNGIFYPQALYNDLAFEVTLAPASQVVKGSDPTKLKYKLTDIQPEYKMIYSQMLAEEAKRVYTTGKEFAYDHVILDKVMPINKGTDTRINIKVNAQRRSMKCILLLFVEPYTAGTRDSEKYIFPDLTKVKVMINGLSNRLYNEGIESEDIWSEVSSFFIEEKNKPQHMTQEKFYTKNNFGLLINLHSMASQEMHGSGIHLVNSTDGVQLQIYRDAKGTGTANCHIFIISDTQFNILNRQMPGDGMQY